MSTWPTFSTLPDQSSWEEQKNDPGMSVDMDGGYVITRARYTRPPRRVFRFSINNASNADKIALDAFWDEVQGTALAFDFLHPINGNTYSVRFITKTAGQPPIAKYANYAKTLAGDPDHRWDLTGIELEEV